MDKIVERNLLYDFYGELLTEHQRKIYEDAVYGDYSLSELAQEYNVSRQGIHDLIRRCDKILSEYEEKLRMIERFNVIKKDAENIIGITDNIDAKGVEEIRTLASHIVESL